jgi:hypothetical protein
MITNALPAKHRVIGANGTGHLNDRPSLRHVLRITLPAKRAQTRSICLAAINHFRQMYRG